MNSRHLRLAVFLVGPKSVGFFWLGNVLGCVTVSCSEMADRNFGEQLDATFGAVNAIYINLARNNFSTKQKELCLE